MATPLRPGRDLSFPGKGYTLREVAGNILHSYVNSEESNLGGIRKKDICALLELFDCVFQVELICARMKDEVSGTCNNHLINFGR